MYLIVGEDDAIVLHFRPMSFRIYSVVSATLGGHLRT